jgi:hypothetical protein
MHLKPWKTGLCCNYSNVFWIRYIKLRVCHNLKDLENRTLGHFVCLHYLISTSVPMFSSLDFLPMIHLFFVLVLNRVLTLWQFMSHLGQIMLVLKHCNMMTVQMIVKIKATSTVKIWNAYCGKTPQTLHLVSSHTI